MLFTKSLRKPRSRHPFPLCKDSEGVTTLLNGAKTFNYEIDCPDLDSLSPDEILGVYSNLQADLCALNTGDWLKFYRFYDSQKSFLTSNKELKTLGHRDCRPIKSATKTMFGGDYPITDIEFSESYVFINGEYWCFVNAQTPPNESYGCFLEEFGEDYIVSIRKLDNSITSSTLKQKRKQQGVATSTFHVNHEGEKSYHEIDQMLENLELGNDAAFNAQIWFILKGVDKFDLIDRAKGLVKKLRNKGASAFLESDGLDFFFNHLVIGSPPSRFREFPCVSSFAANLIPFTKEHLHEKGLELDTRFFPVKLDVFNPKFTNLNTLITGMSGEGKSFFTCSLLYHLHKNEGANLAIFDLGGSFRRLCNYLGGTTLTAKFNPLRFNDPIFLRDFVLSIAPNVEGYKNFSGELLGKLKEFHREKLKFNNFMELVQLLDVTFQGLASYFYEIEDFFSNDLSDPPAVFYLDIKGLPEAAIKPFLLYANKLSESTDNRVVKVFDECWAFMNNSPEIIRSVVKTGRKDNVSSIFITQELNEFSGDYEAVASAVVTNSHTKIYFHQGEITHPSIRPIEKFFLNGVKSSKDVFSEFLFATPDQRKVLRLYPNRFFWQLCNTENDVVRKQEAYIKERLPYMSYQEAFDKWVEYAG